jgi:Tfp pilus assembly protein PilZ
MGRPREASVRFARSAPWVSTVAPVEFQHLGESERRRHPRHSMACHCWIDADQLTVLGPTQDIGVGGLFVRTAVTLDHGTLVDITLRAGDEPETLAARAVVARAVPVRPGYCHGLGLEFVKIHQGQRLLRALLDRTTPAAIGAALHGEWQRP